MFGRRPTAIRRGWPCRRSSAALTRLAEVQAACGRRITSRTDQRSRYTDSSGCRTTSRKSGKGQDLEQHHQRELRFRVRASASV